MRRRDFIAGIAGSTAAWPLDARAEHGKRRIGVLMHYSDPNSDHEARVRVEALEHALQKLGWTKGHNLDIDYRWVGTDSGRFRLHAADLASLKLEVIIAVSSPAVKALQRETQAIPIIFTQVSDPISQGIVKNIARPAGNTTGFTNYDPEIGGKWLELLKEAAPNLTRAAVVFNPRTAPYTALYLRAIEAVAPLVSVEVAPWPIHDDAEIEGALAKLARGPRSGLIVMTGRLYRAEP
jgi:putative ABC transport system substrate-binding protein